MLPRDPMYSDFPLPTPMQVIWHISPRREYVLSRQFTRVLAQVRIYGIIAAEKERTRGREWRKRMSEITGGDTQVHTNGFYVGEEGCS